MVNYIALSGPAVWSTIVVVVSLGLTTYLILIASLRGFFRQYAPLYMYLFATAIVTGIGALFLVLFNFNKEHNVYGYVFFLGALAPLTLFKFGIVCWLYWLILSKDYPSVRFSFCFVFLATVAIFLLYFALSPLPKPIYYKMVSASYYIDQYFRMAQVLLLFILGVIVWAFRLPLNRHLKGIALGLGTSIVLSFVYQELKPLSTLITYFHSVPYLAMLGVFCFYLSSRVSVSSQCTVPELKNLDERLFQTLRATGLFNRYTDPLFFGFFDGQITADLDRWKRYKTESKSKPAASPSPSGSPSLVWRSSGSLNGASARTSDSLNGKLSHTNGSLANKLPPANGSLNGKLS